MSHADSLRRVVAKLSFGFLVLLVMFLVVFVVFVWLAWSSKVAFVVRVMLVASPILFWILSIYIMYVSVVAPTDRTIEVVRLLVFLPLLIRENVL